MLLRGLGDALAPLYVFMNGDEPCKHHQSHESCNSTKKE